MIGEEIYYALKLHITGESITYEQYQHFCTLSDEEVKADGEARYKRWLTNDC